MRTPREISEREIALALVLEFAASGLTEFALLGFYDDDSDFLDDLAKRLDVKYDAAFERKLRRVVQTLVKYGIFYSSMRSTQKYYIDEPAKQMNYGWVNRGKAFLLTAGESEHRGTPEWEAKWLLRYAYPDPEK